MIFYAVLCYTAPECVVLAHNRAGFGGGLAKVGDSPVWATHPWSTLFTSKLGAHYAKGALRARTRYRDHWVNARVGLMHASIKTHFSP